MYVPQLTETEGPALRTFLDFTIRSSSFGYPPELLYPLLCNKPVSLSKHLPQFYEPF